MHIEGNTSGLSAHATKTLERLYRRKVPLQHVATPELVKTLTEASLETHRQVGVLVHRSGQIDKVVVGDASRLMLPDIGRLRAAQGRFRALRLVHTHLFGEPLSRDDIIDLVRLRLDLVCALMLSPAGDLRSLHCAYNTPVHRDGDIGYREIGPEHPSKVHIDFGELIAALESEFARTSRARPVQAKDGRAILVHVGDRRKRAALDQAEAGLRELDELARTAGVEVMDSFVQLRDKRDSRFVVGKGKLDEIMLRASEVDATTLIFDHNLMPSQASAISRLSDLKVIDRTQLILDIFAQRAESVDGKLQVELAQLKYALPRLGMKDDSLSRLTGGIGGRGPGETTLEVGRRRARDRIASLQARLKKLGRQRRQRRSHRQRRNVPIVSIVGYTNAGKSTLLNTLTDADGLVEDKLFATLDTRSRRLRFPEDREVVVTDTVGFIRELPKELFAAFRATFEEMADADLLLHVVDSVDADRDQHMATTEKLLSKLDLHAIPRILVYNKADRLNGDDRSRIIGGRPDAVVISALDRQSTRPLLEQIAAKLSHRWQRAATVPEPDSYEAALDQDGGEDAMSVAGDEDGSADVPRVS